MPAQPSLLEQAPMPTEEQIMSMTDEQVEEMIAKGKRMALRHGFSEAGSKLIALAGVPFGTPGSTNLLHVVTVSGDELDNHGG